MRENRSRPLSGLMRGSGDSSMVEILWHWRETSQQTEKTNLNLTVMSLVLLYCPRGKKVPVFATKLYRAGFDRKISDFTVSEKFGKIYAIGAEPFGEMVVYDISEVLQNLK